MKPKDLSMDELWRGMPEYDQKDLKPYKTVKVHFASEADYQAFAQLIGQRLTMKTTHIWHPYKAKVSRLLFECIDDESEVPGLHHQ